MVDYFVPAIVCLAVGLSGYFFGRAAEHHKMVKKIAQACQVATVALALAERILLKMAPTCELKSEIEAILVEIARDIRDIGGIRHDLPIKK